MSAGSSQNHLLSRILFMVICIHVCALNADISLLKCLIAPLDIALRSAPTSLSRRELSLFFPAPTPCSFEEILGSGAGGGKGSSSDTPITSSASVAPHLFRSSTAVLDFFASSIHSRWQCREQKGERPLGPC